MIRHFLNPPNWFTSASIFCSCYALMLMTDGTVDAALLRRACALVVFAGIFDLLDGRVARITNRYTEFGVQLDSIADIIGFGVAPAVIAWAWLLQDAGILGIVATFWYVLCAAFRLARFNVGKIDEENRTWELEGHSQGLTSTMSGGILVTMIWIANGYLEGMIHVPSWALALFLGVLGFLMISRLPMRNFRDLRDNVLARRILAGTLGLCAIGFVVHPSLLFGVGGAIYLTFGVADGAIAAVHHRLVRKALMMDEFYQAFDGSLYDDYDDHTGEVPREGSGQSSSVS